MANGVYKGITIAGTSNQSFSHAIEIAVQRAQQTLRELRWFEVREHRGAIRDEQIEYQVEIEVFFKLQPGDDASS
jgi:flavin-binding protein dodecin